MVFETESVLSRAWPQQPCACEVIQLITGPSNCRRWYKNNSCKYVGSAEDLSQSDHANKTSFIVYR